MKKCPYCGKDYPDEASVCEQDATPLDQEQISVSGPPQGTRRWTVVRIASALAGVAVFVIGYFQYVRNVPMVVIENRVYNIERKPTAKVIKITTEAVNYLIKNEPKNPLALFAAVGRGDAQLTKSLLERGADPNRKTSFGHYAIHEAAYHGDKAIVDLLLDAGANVNVRISPRGRFSPNQWTPLHFAAHGGYTNVAAALLANGAKINAKDFWSKTPLNYAREKRHQEMIDLLIRHGGAG